MAEGISPGTGGDIFAAESSDYSPQGQEALANSLAWIDPNADDDGSMTDGGAVVDVGERWDADGHELQADVDPQQRIADRVRTEYETEQNVGQAAELLAEHEAEQHEEAFNEALENYDKLSPEDQFEVSIESVGRGIEAIAPIVDATHAQTLNQELFDGHADAVPMATTLAFFGDNVMQTLENAGITDTAQLTPEVVAQINDPAMAHLFAQGLCQALRMPELLQNGVINPMEMSAALLPYVPAFLSGTSADLYPAEYKLAFAEDVCRAFGQKHMLGNIDPDAAVTQFDNWAKWGARLGAGLRAHRQAQAQPAKERSTRRPARNDNFWGEAVAEYHRRGV